MKRYNHEYFGPGDYVGGNMNEAEDGDWVRYEDHAADRAALVQDRDDWQQVSRDWRYRAEQAEIEARELRADRAALVAQMEAAESAKSEWQRLRNKAYALYRAEAEKRESQVAELTRERDEARGRKPFSFQIRFDGPPGQEGGRFIECETLDGKGVNVGRWEQDGEYWLLMVEGYDAPARLESEVTRLTEALAAAERHPATPTHAAQPATAPTVPQCRNRQPSDGGHSLAYRDGGYCDWCGAKAAQPATAPARAEGTKKREPGCECQWEEGDSPCIVHGVYEAEAEARTEAEQRVRDLEARVEAATRHLKEDDLATCVRAALEALRG